MIDRQSRKAPRQAVLLGVLGVTIFGLTLPATRLAVAELDPLFLTAGRSLLAAGTGQPHPAVGAARAPAAA